MFILFWRTCEGCFSHFFQANSNDTLFSKILSCFVQANKKTLGRSEKTLYTRFYYFYLIFYFFKPPKGNLLCPFQWVFGYERVTIDKLSEMPLVAIQQQSIRKNPGMPCLKGFPDFMLLFKLVSCKNIMGLFCCNFPTFRCIIR